MKIIITMLLVIMGFLHSLAASLIHEASVPIINAISALVATVDKQLPPQTGDTLAGALSQVSRKISTRRALYRIHTIRPNLRSLPRNIRTKEKAAVGNVVVLAGDNRVSQSVVTSASQIIGSISLPTLQANIGHTPSHSVDIVLFSTPGSYAAELAKAGVPANEISSIVNNTGGITVNSDIWIPLYALQDKADLADVLTHELTHVVFNQMGIGRQLPTWLNEGTAWYDGLAGQASVDPSGTQSEIAASQASVLQAVQSHQSLPLTATEAQILDASYNVEFEDYMATQNLLKHYGASAFKSFISHSVSQGVPNSFAAQFGITMNNYAQSFYQALQQAGQQSVQQPVQSPQTGWPSNQIVVVPNPSAHRNRHARFRF